MSPGTPPPTTRDDSERIARIERIARLVEFVQEHREVAPGVSLLVTRSPYTGYFSWYSNVDVDGSDSTNVR